MTANEMIVARRTLKFKIEPIPLNGWQTSTDPYEETRDLRNNINGNVFNNFTGVSFIEDHTDPDDNMMNGWEWIVPYVRVADLQVDSLNENPYGGVSGSDEEDAQEDTDSGGKILGCNVKPYSPDSNKPGWADFSAAPASHPPFAAMHLFLQGFPSGTKVRFQYSCSDPAGITLDDEGNWIRPEEGCLRVWTKNVYNARTINDFIKKNTSYTLEDLQSKHAQVADGHFVFYVEAVKSGASASDNQVTVEVQTPGSSWATLDTVRLISYEITTRTPPYSEGTVEEGPINNIISTWPGKKIELYVDLNGLQENATIPPNFIEWSVPGPGNQIPINKRRASVEWSTPGTRQILITVGAEKFRVVIDVPDVGTMGQEQAAALNPLAAFLAKAYALDAQGWAASAFPDQNVSDTLEANALMHSCWNALMASEILIGPSWALLFSTAHEFNNWAIDHGDAFDTTMDLHNNYIGSLEVHTSVILLGSPDYPAIQTALLQRLSQGDLWIVLHEFAESETTNHISGHVVKSNHKKIFPLE